MNKRLPFLFFLKVAVVFGLLHFFGIYLQLYWRVSGYDKLSHLTGGFFATCLVLTVLYIKRLPGISRRELITVGLFAALVVGIAWELFELRFGITALSDAHYFRDNGGDVLFDVLGGAAGLFYFITHYGKSAKQIA